MSQSEELLKLMALRIALNDAIKSQRRADKCHANFISKTHRDGFSRASTTTYNARASSNAIALKSDMQTLKEAILALFNIELPGKEG